MSSSNGHNEANLTERVYRIIQERPAIHFRGLKRAAEITSNGQLRHHLDQLDDEDALIEIEDGGYTRFFIPGEHPPEIREALARFARQVPRTIGKLLLDGSMTRSGLREALGCADSTLGYHLNRMIKLGDVEREQDPRRSMYTLTDPDLVRRVLRVLDEIPAREQAGTPKASHNGHGLHDGQSPSEALGTA